VFPANRAGGYTKWRLPAATPIDSASPLRTEKRAGWLSAHEVDELTQ